MDKLSSKIYYELQKGNVLVITPECQGCVIETTKEEDMKIYEQLQGKSIDEVDYITLEYGTLATTFTNTKSYKVNLETKRLEILYFTEEELEDQNEKYKQQVQKTQNLNSRVSDISQYLTSNIQTISNVEDLILQTEQNKILKLEGKM